MRWNRPWSLAMLLTLPAWPLQADSLDAAYKAYEKGQFEEAAKGFGAHTQKKPDDYDQLYNAGVALLQKGAHEEALTYFDRAMLSPDPALKSRAAYNRGVALAQKQKWTEAAAAFQNALSYDNENKMIQENLQFAHEQKERQKKQDPQQNKDQGSDSQQAENKPGQPQNGDEARNSQNAQASNATPDKNGKDKGAQEQAGQPQNAQEQKSAQPGQEQNVHEQKSAQDMGQEQSAQPGQQKSAQEQNFLEQKSAQSTPSPGQNHDQVEQKSAPGKGQPQSTPSPGQNLDQEKSASEGQPQLVDKDGNGTPGQTASGQRVLTIKDLKKQEAEKLLRSVDDRVGTYILTPAQENTEGKSRNGKDW